MSDIRELETFLTLPHREGEVRWTLKDAGNGPAIDGRLYKPKGWAKVQGQWVEVTYDEPHPQKQGLWIPLEQAERLADALPFAVLRGYDLRASGGYAADGGPSEDEPRPGWNCPDCGTENIAENRHCSRCNSRKRIGVMS